MRLCLAHRKYINLGHLGQIPYTLRKIWEINVWKFLSLVPMVVAEVQGSIILTASLTGMPLIALTFYKTWSWGSFINVNCWGSVSLCVLSNLIWVDQSQGFRLGLYCRFLCVTGVSSTYPKSFRTSGKHMILVLDIDSNVSNVLSHCYMASVEIQPSFTLTHSCPSLSLQFHFLKIGYLDYYILF